MRQTHEEVQPQSLVKFSFIGTSNRTPEEIRNFFFNLETDTVALESSLGEKDIIQDCEFSLELVEWHDEEKQWQEEEAEEERRNS